MARPVCTYGNPILRTQSQPVKAVSKEIGQLADRMFATMQAAKGIGLAAEQFGSTEAIFVLDVPQDADEDVMGNPLHPDVPMPEVFINPQIIAESEEEETAEEGCLSFPGLYVPVTRPTDIVCRYTNRKGETKEIEVSGLLSRAIQHEYDHLQGILLVDYMSKASKIRHGLILRKLKKSNKTQ